MTLTGTSRHGRHRGRLLLVTAVVAALTLTTGTACAKSNKGDDAGANQGLTNIDKSPGAGDGSGDGGSGSSPGDGSGDGSSPSTQPSAKPSTTKATPKGPVIKSFTVSVKQSCGSPGGPGFDPISGSVTLKWSVTGTDMIGISIDDENTYKQYGGHGSWKDYPATGSDTFPFSCGGQAAADFTHTYIVSTIGGGALTVKKLTLTAHWPGASAP